MHISEIETPAILIDLDIFERNLARVADYAKSQGLRLRPHTKTHKIPDIGRRQVELGAAGLTVAKVGEAEVMKNSGTPDLLLAYPVVGKSKLERLAKVAGETAVTVALDNLISAGQLSDAARSAGVEFGVLVEIDAGLARVGVKPEEATGLAREIQKLPGLRLEGITFYPGHIKKSDHNADDSIRALSDLVEGVLADFRKEGLDVKVVSGGSTPLLWRSHEVRGVNEIRPGTYVFNDANTVRSGACDWSDCAASILVTVVSTARPGYMIIDGGSKTFSSDRVVNSGEATFGRFANDPEVVFYNMNEEHGYVDIRKAGNGYAVGNRIQVIPNHICVAVNLHERLYGIRGQSVERIWEVEGRGKLQ